MTPEDAAGPGGGTARAGTCDRARTASATNIVPRQGPKWRARLTPEERFDRYGDPTDGYRDGMPFGLTIDQLRAEWKRCAAIGFARWELDARLAPRGVS